MEWGWAALVGKVELTGRTASISTTTIITTPSAGNYRASIYLVNVTGITAGTVLATIGWTDPKQAQTEATGTISLITAGSHLDATFVLRCTSGTVISYATTAASVVGSPNYDIFVTLERIG